MRILAHIHTMNDADVIEQLLAGLRRQTRPLDAILIVDNASVDDTLNRPFGPDVTVIRNAANQGTSGTVRTGFAHALEHGFDWVWVFDADSVPAPDALERLLGFFDGLPAAERERVCFLAGPSLTDTGEIKEPPISLAGPGMKLLRLAGDAGFTECDCVLWSGSLYRTAAIARIGLPTADYVLDIAELEYGYRARRLGFTSYIVHDSVIHHDVGRHAGAAFKVLRVGPLSLNLYEVSAPRSYYSARNSVYFWLYQSKPRHVSVTLRAIVRAAVFALGFGIRPFSHRRQLAASVRGLWDGLTGHLERRY